MDNPAPATIPSIWRKPWFERLYRIGIIIKGIDGFLQLFAGVAILISPRLVHVVLGSLITQLGAHNTRPFQFLAEYVGRVDANLVRSGLIFLTLFLIFHGVIKIGLAYCLLRRIEHAYPIALILLLVFLGYEVYVFATSLSILLAIFMVLDMAIIWLVWNEYQELKTNNKKVVK